MFLPLGDDVKKVTIPIIPLILIAANLLVFAYQTRIRVSDLEKGPEAEMEFVETFGLVPAELADGQVIGLLTHMFIHGGVMHILGNMVVLWAFAGSLELGMGRWNLLAFYLLWGVAGGGAHAAMDLSSEIPMVGASGAIAGLMGAYTVAYGPATKIRGLLFIFFHPIRIQIPAMGFGILWLMMQMWDASFAPEGGAGVAWFAHIGGFLAGVVTMACMKNQMENVLVQNEHGELEFSSRKELEAVDAEPEVPEWQSAPVAELAPGETPTTCPYCQTELNESCWMAPTLGRCANTDCQQLIYVEEP